MVRVPYSESDAQELASDNDDCLGRGKAFVAQGTVNGLEGFSFGRALGRQIDQPSIFGVALFGETAPADLAAGVLRPGVHAIGRYQRIAVMKWRTH